ncbi:hypothetical protein BC826DRAFT_118208 [Russula brevipes]|nr:hypothetical protein BC826DRAFT_118208 [Russula brevipes]
MTLCTCLDIPLVRTSTSDTAPCPLTYECACSNSCDLKHLHQPKSPRFMFLPPPYHTPKHSTFLLRLYRGLHSPIRSPRCTWHHRPPGRPRPTQPSHGGSKFGDSSGPLFSMYLKTDGRGFETLNNLSESTSPLDHRGNNYREVEWVDSNTMNLRDYKKLWGW